MNNFFPSSILVVASHPDDEVLMAGGTLARNFKSGGKNYVIFMTNGVGSRDNLDPISKSNKRLEEARKANFILGSEIIDCYDFPDNALDSISLHRLFLIFRRLLCQALRWKITSKRYIKSLSSRITSL